MQFNPTILKEMIKEYGIQNLLFKLDTTDLYNKPLTRRLRLTGTYEFSGLEYLCLQPEVPINAQYNFSIRYVESLINSDKCSVFYKKQDSPEEYPILASFRHFFTKKDLKAMCHVEDNFFLLQQFL